jgi:hypothetical protein
MADSDDPNVDPLAQSIVSSAQGSRQHYKQMQIETALRNLKGYRDKVNTKIKSNTYQEKDLSTAKKLVTDVDRMLKEQALDLKMSDVDEYIDDAKKLLK